MTPEAFQQQLHKDLKAIRYNTRDAIQRTARKAVRIIRKNTPHAFGELQDSIHVETGAKHNATVVSAPHAQAVEVGARPHLIPLEELVKWVKLRGTQGLSKQGRIVRKQEGWQGPTSRGHAIRVASELKALENDGALDVNAPEVVAKAIQMAIMKNGIKPTWFVQKSLPEIASELDSQLHDALRTISRHYY